MHKLGLASLGGPEEPQGTEGNPRSQRVPGIPRVPRDPPPSLLHEAKYIPFNRQPPRVLFSLHQLPRALYALTGKSLPLTMTYTFSSVAK